LVGAGRWIHSYCQPCLAKQLVLHYGVVHHPIALARSKQPLPFLINIKLLLFGNFLIHMCMR
jgi:hypothetical protein